MESPDPTVMFPPMRTRASSPSTLNCPPAETSKDVFVDTDTLSLVKSTPPLPYESNDMLPAVTLMLSPTNVSMWLER